MIECIFTIDYEIYGNGQGALTELVYRPAEKLKEIFEKYNARFMPFVEAAELEMIEAAGSDSAIELVKQQVQKFHNEGYEIGLHLHPQWYNAKFENGTWALDYSEYNLCSLPEARIAQIVDRSIDYLRKILGESEYRPISFRAGNWLFQPTHPAAKVLAGRGIKIDSSVFKGGLQRKNGLDYRAAIENGFFWKFQGDVNSPNPQGTMLEIPIYTQMVYSWKMLSSKRVGLQRKGSHAGPDTNKNRKLKSGLNRLLDFSRFRYPLKFDFCRMTLEELISVLNTAVKEDETDPLSAKPIVAIGHTKDLIDFETVDSFLSYLDQKKIPISTFKDVYQKCIN